MIKDNKKAREALLRVFQEEHFLKMVGRAHIGVTWYGPDGQGYFSYRWVDASDLHGRRYIVYIANGDKIHIKMLDCLFNREMWKSPGLSNRDKLEFRRRRLGIAFLERYKRGKLYEKNRGRNNVFTKNC